MTTSTPEVIHLGIELADGTERVVSIPLDFDDLTFPEASAALVLAGPSLARGDEVSPAHVAAFLFVKMRREIPELRPADFGVFREQLITAFEEATRG